MLYGHPHWGARKEKMKKKFFCILLLLVLCVVNMFSLTGIPISNKNVEIHSISNGKVIEVKKNNSLFNLVISTEEEYYYNSESKNYKYELIYTDLKEIYVKKGDFVDTSTTIGISSDYSFIKARAKKLSPLVVRYITEKIEIEKKYYYFSPIWLVIDHPLSYRFTENLPGTINTYINRVEQESDNLENDSFIFDYLESEDRISFYITLPSYPNTLGQRSNAIAKLCEANFILNKTVHDTELGLLISEDTILYLFFSSGLSNYMKNEINLKYIVELYGHIVAYLPGEKKEVVIFIDDFQINTDKQLVEHNTELLSKELKEDIILE